MPFHIVVDGYNVIGSEQGLRGDLEPKRTALVKEMAAYRARTGHLVTTVFDGWRNGRIEETRQQAGDVTVVFSRYGEKADAVIERLAREIGNSCVVVTSDRDLRRSVENGGAVAVYVNEFLAKLRLDPDAAESEEDAAGDEPFPGSRDRRKKGNPRQPSKTERARRQRLAKL